MNEEAMIPTEAINAAAKWLHDIDCRSAVHSGHPADIVCYDWIDEAKELVATIAPHMLRPTRIALLVSHGLPMRDAETALTAYDRTPRGEPQGADAVRVAAILGDAKVIPDEAVEAAWRAFDITGREDMDAALEAAAPYLMRTAWDEGWDAHSSWPGPTRNPYIRKASQ
jgi:hypothetical protein